MRPFVIGIFHLACSQGSSMLQQVSVLHSFLWLDNIDLYGIPHYAYSFIRLTFGLFSHFGYCK